MKHRPTFSLLCVPFLILVFSKEKKNCDGNLSSHSPGEETKLSVQCAFRDSLSAEYRVSACPHLIRFNTSLIKSQSAIIAEDPVVPHLVWCSRRENKTAYRQLIGVNKAQ